MKDLPRPIGIHWSSLILTNNTHNYTYSPVLKCESLTNGALKTFFFTGWAGYWLLEHILLCMSGNFLCCLKMRIVCLGCGQKARGTNGKLTLSTRCIAPNPRGA